MAQGVGQGTPVVPFIERAGLNIPLGSGAPSMEEIAEHESAVNSLRTDLEIWLQGSIDIAAALSALIPSRELALVMTKLDEAQMWLERVEGGK